MESRARHGASARQYMSTTCTSMTASTYFVEIWNHLILQRHVGFVVGQWPIRVDQRLIHLPVREQSASVSWTFRWIAFCWSNTGAAKKIWLGVSMVPSYCVNRSGDR